MIRTLASWPLVLVLSLVFILRPNLNHFSHVLTRAGDAMFLMAIVVFVVAGRKVAISKKFVALLAPLLCSFFVMFLFGVYPGLARVFNYQDFLEIARVPLFIVLPFFVGYNYFGESVGSIYVNVRRFFYLVLVVTVVLMFLQFLGVFSNLFIKLYAQANLNQGRATGVALFIQECTWIILTCVAMLSDHRINGRGVGGREIVLVYIIPFLALLTASKTAVLMSLFFVLFALVFLDYRFFRDAKFYVAILCVVVATVLAVNYLAEHFLQFRVSFYDAVIAAFNGDFSDKSYTQRLHTFDRLLDDIDSSPLSILYGTDPLFTHRTLRYEMSFFNMSAKYGLLGFLSFGLVYMAGYFVRIERGLCFSRSAALLVCVALSIIVASVTGASMEGVKGSFLFFMALGVVFRVELLYAANCSGCGR